MLRRLQSTLLGMEPGQAANFLSSEPAYRDEAEFQKDLDGLCRVKDMDSYAHLFQVAMALELGYPSLSDKMFKTLMKPLLGHPPDLHSPANRAAIIREGIVTWYHYLTGATSTYRDEAQVQRLLVRFYEAQPDERQKNDLLDNLIEGWKPTHYNSFVQFVQNMQASRDPAVAEIGGALSTRLDLDDN